ncbi:MAG: hypothetical protein JSV58_00735 [Candidatus Bathyarchaeota archaeon]|nr:MAG: hypothetical protein JSV58_00735 [Candidatus Bathyarchaeota archaeon]
MKLNRIMVWLLLLLMILLVITGYGLTKPNLVSSFTGGWIDYWTAQYLHTLLDLPLLLLLLVHVIIEIKFSFMRWGFKSRNLLKALMLSLGVICTILILYIEVASL